MADAHQSSSHHRRPHTSPMAAPFLEFDFTRELERLHAEADWSSGHNAKTLVKYDNLRVVLMALKAGARVPEHQARGGFRSRPSPAISGSERKVERSICRPEPCSLWIRICRMTWKPLKRARSSSRSLGAEANGRRDRYAGAFGSVLGATRGGRGACRAWWCIQRGLRGARARCLRNCGHPADWGRSRRPAKIPA